MKRMDFDGKTFDRALDGDRLTGQWRMVFDLMKDGAWRTLRDIAQLTGCPEASVSARLRDFRKEKFGGHTVNRERKYTEGVFSVWIYQLLPSGNVM